nr:YSIRK-type signal peptide-containing protein [Staphylococcus simulans]
MKQPNRRLDFLPNKQNKYSIRKFTVGTASILVGATLMFGLSHDAQAAEEQTSSTDTTQTQSESPKPNSDTTSQPTQETKTTAVVTPPVTTEAPASENTAPHNPELNRTTSEAPTTIEQAPQPEETNPTAKDTTPESTPTIDPTSESNPTIHTRAKRSLDTEPQVEAPVNNETYNGKIIDYTGSDLVKKVANPGIETAPSEINFSPKFVDGRSKSYAFIVKKDKTVQKHLTTANGHGNIHAYFGDYITLNKDNSEAYVYFSSLGVADGHSVDALAHIVVNTAKSSDVNQTRYFLTSGTDLLSMVSLAGGGSTATLNFLKNTDQTVIDKLYNSVSTNDTITHVLDELNKIKGDAERVNGLFNIYDLDDYRTNLDTRKSVTFNRDQIEKLYVSSKERHVASSNLELKDGKVIISSGQHPYGEKYGFPNRVTVSYLNQSEITYSMTGQNASGPAFHPEGLLLVPIQPFSTKDNPNSKGDGAITLLQYLPDRKVTQPETLPTKLEIKAVFPDGVKASLTPTNYFTGLTQDKLNELTIVPGTNGVAKPEYFKQQAFYNKSYELPVSLEHQLTTEDIKNDSTKWQSLQKYYDADKGVIEVPVTWSFDNGVNKWEHLDTDNDMIALKVSDALKNEIDNKTKADATASIEEAEIADKEAKAKLQQAIGDSLVSETEYNNLTNAKTNGESKKNTAQEKVNMLPERLRTELQEELNKLDGINLPEINDRNNNNILDEQDKLIEEAKALLKEAEDAEDKAKTTLQQANVNDAISPEEHNNLSALQQDFTAKKKAAEAKIRAVHENHQSPLINQLNQLVGITVPEVNDNDNNGKPDTEDKKEQQASALKNAEDLVSKAEEADNTAQIQLQKANEDKLIKPLEHTDLTATKENADTTKSTADTAVKALPQEMQDSLLERLEKLKGIQVPNINDRNNNNISDGQDALIVEAEASLKEAKDAEDKAKSTLEEANANNAITPEEHTHLTAAKEDAHSTKSTADAAVKALPQEIQTPLLERLAKLDGIEVPVINDHNNNNIPDEQDALIAEAKDLLAAVKAADQKANEELTKAEADKAINQQEHDNLENLQQDFTTKKQAASDKINQIEEKYRGDLPTQLEALKGITVPAVNDTNRNGKPDEQDAKEQQDAALKNAEDLVKKAEAADQATQTQLQQANVDNLIKAQEHQDLTEAQKKAVSTKAEATEKVNALPEALRTPLEQELAKLDGIRVPDINDDNNNMIPDTQDALVKAAEEAIEKAKAVDALAKSELTKANENQAISSEEHQTLQNLQHDFEQKKATAQQALDAVDPAYQGVLPGKLKALTGIDVPEVNDANSNDVADDKEAELRKLVQKVIETDKAAKAAILAIQDDGLVNPDEIESLRPFKLAAYESKMNAFTDVHNLSDGTPLKAELLSVLRQYPDLIVPPVNDNNANDIPDSEDLLIRFTGDALKEAQAADKAAKEMLAQALKPNALIDETEHQALVAAQANFEQKKALANEKINAIQEVYRKDLPQQLAALTGITVPEVNDKDKNGIRYDVDQAIHKAKEAVEAAKAAYNNALTQMDDIQKDNIITPEESADLAKAISLAEDKKAAAQTLVDALLSEPVKQTLQLELDALTPIGPPQVNDENHNGVPDKEDSLFDEAAKAYEVAKNAEAVAQTALEEVQADGVVNPDEQAQLKALQEEFKQKKALAEEKLEAIESKYRQDLPEKVQALTGISIPSVNDKNQNGIRDDIDTLIDKAQQLINATKDMAQAAQAKADEASADGLINPSELEVLSGAKNLVEANKAAAQAAIDALPMAYQKDLQLQLDAINEITLPTVNDQDNNHIDDHTDALKAAVQDLVDEAKRAHETAQQQLESIQQDQLVTPKEQSELINQVNYTKTAKHYAQKAVDMIDENLRPEFQPQLDALKAIDIPEVNDKNVNGIDDNQDQLMSDALQAIKAAEAAEKVAQAGLETAQDNGVINDDEHDMLSNLQKAFLAQKNIAKDKIALVDDALKGELLKMLDALTGIAVPAVNDHNHNDVDDTLDQTLQDLINAVKAAHETAQDDLIKANADYLITPQEQDTLIESQNHASKLKEQATETIQQSKIPAAVKDELVNALAQMQAISIPDINDQNANGIADDIDTLLEQAEARVAQAEKMNQEVQSKLDTANENGLITPQEHQNLLQHQALFEGAKDSAQQIVKQLPAAYQSPFEVRLKQLQGITVPNINDQNANNISDADDAALAEATEFVRVAQAMDAKLQEKLATNTADGLVTPSEYKQLAQLQAIYEDVKAQAKEKVNQLPLTLQGNLPKDLVLLKGITLPQINDQNENGIDDNVDVLINEARDAVKAAQSADEHAQTLFDSTVSDNLVTPQEQTLLKSAQEEAQILKTSAERKVNVLPSELKGNLPALLAQLQGIDIPEINDANANGTNDIQDQWLNDAEAAVKAAELADKASQSAWNMAVSDNLITPQEQTLLKSAQEEAQTLKATAERKVNALPSELKGDLPALLAQLQGIDIPEINDANANGTNDIQDQWLNEAEAALKEAISSNNTAHIELEKVLSDHRVQTEEQEALAIVQEKAKTTKELAQSAIAQLPSELKGNLISELNNIENIEIPAVTEDKSTTSLEKISNEVVSEKSVTTTTQREEIHLENADEISLNQMVSETTSSVDLNTESEVKQEVKTDDTNKQQERTTEEEASSERTSLEVENQTEITQKHQTSKDNNASDESTNEHQDTTRTSDRHMDQNDEERSSQTSNNPTTRTTHPEQTVSSKQQKALPNTGQSQSNSILVGGLATLIGVAFLVSSRRRKN